MVSGWIQVIGSFVLFATAMSLDPSSIRSVENLAQPTVLASFAFLVVFGSVIAFTLYMKLTNEWSPSRAGSYAFVSPGIALIAGIVVLGESLTATEIAGCALMLGGTILSLGSSGEAA